VLARSGATQDATTAFSAFTALWPQADPHLPELQRARLFLDNRSASGGEQAAQR
jgi:hypothetical protein